MRKLVSNIKTADETRRNMIEAILGQKVYPQPIRPRTVDTSPTYANATIAVHPTQSQIENDQRSANGTTFENQLRTDLIVSQPLSVRLPSLPQSPGDLEVRDFGVNWMDEVILNENTDDGLELLPSAMMLEVERELFPDEWVRRR